MYSVIMEVYFHTVYTALAWLHKRWSATLKLEE